MVSQVHVGTMISCSEMLAVQMMEKEHGNPVILTDDLFQHGGWGHSFSLLVSTSISRACH